MPPDEAGSESKLTVIPEEPKDIGGPDLAQRIAEVRAAQAEGRDFMAEAAGEEPEKEAAAEEPEEPEEEAGEEQEQEEEEEAGPADEESLPAGWERTESGKLKRPDGTWANQEDIAAIEAGEVPPWQVRQDEGEYQTVKLPGRHPGDPDSEWELADPELVEEINRLRNGYMRKEEADRQLEAAATQRQENEQVAQENLRQAQELEDVYFEMSHDPIGFVLDKVTKPELRQGIAIHLLHDEDVFKAVLDEFGQLEWDDPQLQAKRAERRVERLERRQQMQDERAHERAERAQLQTFRSLLEGWGEQVPVSQRAVFYEVAAQRVARVAGEQNIELFSDVERDVTEILKSAGTFAAFDIDPSRRSSQGSDPAVQERNGDEPRGAGTDRLAAPAEKPGSAGGGRPPAKAQRRTGEDFKRSARARRAAASVAHGGTGAAPAHIEKPPEGQDVKERIKWFNRTHR